MQGDDDHNANNRTLTRFGAGDEVFFKADSLLIGTVQRAMFDGTRVRYEIAVNLVCEVPERLVLDGMKAE